MTTETITTQSRELVLRFLKLVNDDRDLTSASALLDESISFDGPLAKISGLTAYTELVAGFLPAMQGWTFHGAVADGEEVVIFDTLHLTMPDGASFDADLAERFTLRDGKILAHKIFYDPRELAQHMPTEEAAQ